VTLNWDPPANAAGYVTKYVISFWDNNNCCFHGEEVVNGSTTSTVITKDSGLRPLTTFTFKVKAYIGDGVSKEWRIASTFIALTPGPVQNLTAVVDTRKPSVTLNWDPPVYAAGYVTKYVICIQDNNSGFYGEKVVNGSTTTTVITRESRLRPLSTFTFGVRAYSGDGVNQLWPTVSAFVALTPGPIRNLTSDVNPLKPSVVLKWDPPANAGYPGYVTKYLIFFLNNENICYGMKVVKGCTTTTVITGVSESSETLSSLEVKAYSGNHESQTCRSVLNLNFAGMYVYNRSGFT